MASATAPVTTTKRVGAAVIVGILLAGVVFAGLKLVDWSIPLPSFITGESFQDVGPTVVESIQKLSELTTVEMIEHTTIEKGEDYGWLNVVRGDRLFLFAVARIGAGVDLSELSAESFVVDSENGTVLVRLPAPEITYSYLDSEATRVVDRDTGLLHKGDPQLESEARRQAEQILTEQALAAGILETAQENAELAVSELLHGLGYSHVMIERGPINP
jgi:hypothetical protein